jgi:hypothetical protein
MASVSIEDETKSSRILEVSTKKQVRSKTRAGTETRTYVPTVHIPIAEGERWPHTANIHCVGQTTNPDSFFEQTVCATQKIDGSNLSIHIKKVDGEWSIVKLNGRNTKIWDPEMGKDITDLSYGSPEKLEKLPIVMFDYCVRLANLLSESTDIDELYVYGEAYRMEGQKFVSWHPFGYRVPQIVSKSKSTRSNACSESVIATVVTDTSDTSDTTVETTVKAVSTASTPDMFDLSLSINFLTTRTHELFLSVQESHIPRVKTVEEFCSMLVDCDDHIICPPICLFTGKLVDCVNEMFEKMKTHSKLFEGCFIIFESKSQGFKWKTGLFEEQKKIVSISETMFNTEANIEAFKKLEYIFNTRPIDKHDTGTDCSEPELKKISIGQMQSDLLTACKHELTKFTSISEISSIPKKDRKNMVSELCNLSILEVIQLYKESGCSIPWSNTELRRHAISVINPFIMKIDYVSPM